MTALLALESAGSAQERRARAQLAFCLQSGRRSDEAVREYETALDGDTSDSWEGAAVALLNYAELRAAQERWPEAEGLAKRALRLLSERSDAALLAAAQANLGSYLALQSRWADAEPLLTTAAKQLARHCGPESPFAVACAADAVRALRAQGKTREADEFLESCDATLRDAAGKEVLPDDAMEEEIDRAMQSLWQPLDAKKSFDPPGFLRDADMSEDEIKAFMKQWEEMGLPTEPGMMESIMKGFEQAGEEEGLDEDIELDEEGREVPDEPRIADKVSPPIKVTKQGVEVLKGAATNATASAVETKQ